MPGHSSVPSGVSAKGPALVPLGHHAGKPAIPLHRPVMVIGSRSTCRIRLLSKSVSKAHCILIRDGARMYIRDLASRSQLFVNGQRTDEKDLEDGDLLKIGSFTLQFVSGPEISPEGPRKSVAPATLDVSGAETPVPVEGRVVLIGRRKSCDITLLEESVSTAHAVIFEKDGEHFIRDLGSRTGTQVNRVKVHQHNLSAGDLIRIGDTDMTFVPSPGAAGVDVLEEPPALLERESEVDAVAESIAEQVRLEPRAAVTPPASEPPIAVPSADIAADSDELLVGAKPPAEKWSEPLEVSETQARVAETPQAPAPPPQDIRPRWGWRKSTASKPPAPAAPKLEISPAAPPAAPEPVVPEPVAPVAEVVQPSPPEAPQESQEEEDLLRFKEPESTAESAAAGAAVLDREVDLPAVEPAPDEFLEPPITAGAFTEKRTDTVRPAPLEIEPIAPREPEPVAPEFKFDDLDLKPDTEPEPQPAAPSDQAVPLLNLSPPTLAPHEPSDTEAPLLDAAALEAEFGIVPDEKKPRPSRSRKKRSPGDPPPERVAVSKTRNAPTPVAEQHPEP
ncbi:MAG: FHA domain-containing protein, partial [Tepidisphaeraceae bacterium]